MSFRFTPHALARIAERAIEAEWLDTVLSCPKGVVPAQPGRKELQGMFERGGKPMLSRVTVKGDLVVTAVLKSKSLVQ